MTKPLSLTINNREKMTTVNQNKNQIFNNLFKGWHDRTNMVRLSGFRSACVIPSKKAEFCMVVLDILVDERESNSCYLTGIIQCVKDGIFEIPANGELFPVYLDRVGRKRFNFIERDNE